MRAFPFIFASLAMPFLLTTAHAQDAGKRYALLVGVRDYQHQALPKLAYSENDVVELAKVLRLHAYDVTLLSDGAGNLRADLAPTAANIRAHVKRLLEKAQRADTVLLAFAGHGLQFERDENDQPLKDAFFCPSDARPFVNRRDTLISFRSLYVDMKESFAGIKVLLVDACRNDPMLGRGARNGIDPANSPRPPRGVGAFFSCSAQERAYEHDKFGHGIFFHYVLEGLKGAAKDDENEVTFASLQAYVSRRVARDVPTLIGNGAKQSPNVVADLSGASPVLATIKLAEPARIEPKPPVFVNPITAIRLKAQRSTSANNLRQIGVAVHNYHEAHGHLPLDISMGNRKLLSWRVALLPFLDEAELYNSFRRDEPWDSVHNKSLLSKMPKVFEAPGDTKHEPFTTFYQVFQGKGAMFENGQKLKLADIRDGTSNTLLAVEAAQPVAWTKPEDLPYDAKMPLPKLGGVFANGLHAIFADGATYFLRPDIDENTLRALITRDGKESVGPIDDLTVGVKK